MDGATVSGSVWLIGCGNMGGAMLRGWRASGLDAGQVTIIDPALPDVADVRVLAELPKGEAPPALLLLAIKPQILSLVAPQLAPCLGAETLVMSILAGVEVATLRAALTAPRRIVRVMPNMPASIGKGVSVAYAPDGDVADHAQVEALLAPLGHVEWVQDDALFHAVTALSGSGPAFVFRFIDALAQAGTALGLPADQALRLAIGTVEGSAALAAGSTESPTTLAAQVTSPNGTTAAGLDVLDAEGMFFDRVSATIKAAAHRSQELAAAAKP
jgi:pyrroline-5-carboxylate reductase